MPKAHIQEGHAHSAGLVNVDQVDDDRQQALSTLFSPASLGSGPARERRAPKISSATASNPGGARGVADRRTGRPLQIHEFKFINVQDWSDPPLGGWVRWDSQDHWKTFTRHDQAYAPRKRSQDRHGCHYHSSSKRQGLHRGPKIVSAE